MGGPRRKFYLIKAIQAACPDLSGTLSYLAIVELEAIAAERGVDISGVPA